MDTRARAERQAHYERMLADHAAGLPFRLEEGSKAIMGKQCADVLFDMQWRDYLMRRSQGRAGPIAPVAQEIDYQI